MLNQIAFKACDKVCEAKWGGCRDLKQLYRDIIDVIEAEVKHIELLRDYFEDLSGRVNLLPLLVK